MPNYFQLFKKSEPKVACKFVEIDEEMCKALSVTPDPVKYHMNWYDDIGYCIACGKTLQECVDVVKKKIEEDPSDEWMKRYLKVAEYLNDNYTSDAWYSPIK